MVSGKTYWVVANREQVVLPDEKLDWVGGKGAAWYLLNNGEEYYLYPIEDIQSLEYSFRTQTIASVSEKPFASYSKEKYEYKVEDSRIVISEKKTLVESFLKVTYRGKAGVESVIDGLEKILESFTEEKLTSLQYELDMFREDYDDFLTHEQVEWFDRLYDIVASELDARWLLKKLEECHIVKIERGN